MPPDASFTGGGASTAPPIGAKSCALAHKSCALAQGFRQHVPRSRERMLVHGMILGRRSFQGHWPVASLYHNATGESPVLKLWNESRTNRGRIADSIPVRL